MSSDNKIRGLGPEHIQVWHDEMERYERTGSLDQGPCWCPDCIKEELKDVKG